MSKILNIKLFPKNISSAVSVIKEDCFLPTKNNFCISVTGAHGIIIAKKDKAFKTILHRPDRCQQTSR